MQLDFDDPQFIRQNHKKKLRFFCKHKIADEKKDGIQERNKVFYVFLYTYIPI